MNENTVTLDDQIKAGGVTLSADGKTIYLRRCQACKRDNKRESLKDGICGHCGWEPTARERYDVKHGLVEY